MGFAHPDTLLAQLTSKQVSDWMAYFAIEPFESDRADWRIGEVWAAMIGLWTKKGSKTHTTKDFVERMRRRFDPQPVKALNRKIKGVLKRFGDG